jgi:hypothetical protein
MTLRRNKLEYIFLENNITPSLIFVSKDGEEHNINCGIIISFTMVGNGLTQTSHTTLKKLKQTL